MLMENAIFITRNTIGSQSRSFRSENEETTVNLNTGENAVYHLRGGRSGIMHIDHAHSFFIRPT